MDSYNRIGEPFGMDCLLGYWEEWGCKGEAEGVMSVDEGKSKIRLNNQ